MTPIDSFYKGKDVLVTGHTGFKGSWLCRILFKLGANVHGYSLEPPSEINLYEMLGSDSYVDSKIDDIRNYDSLSEFYRDTKPDVVFHLAAQPIVKEGYSDPRYTYETNVMGTVNILECVRKMGAESFLNVTTDKVYRNPEDYSHRFKEGEELDGFDPYSNSKSCSELVTHTYVRSFPGEMCPVSTARAGNVIGGGDFAPDRIVPDCVRAAVYGKDMVIRNPNSIRPYQHVLEPLYSYLVIAAAQTKDRSLSGSYNIGPDDDDCITTGELANIFSECWGDGMNIVRGNEKGPHEANYLKLDNILLKDTFGIAPLWNVRCAIEKTVEWTKVWKDDGDVKECVDNQISEYLKKRGINV